MSKRFNMVLSDEDYARMEGLRSRLGLRSWAEVIRAMLASAELDADIRDHLRAAPKSPAKPKLDTSSAMVHPSLQKGKTK